MESYGGRLQIPTKSIIGKENKKWCLHWSAVAFRNMDLNDSFEWTKAVVLLTVASIFDPSGLISTYIIKYKLFLRDVSLDKKTKRWRSLTKELE